ncbi:MAG: cytochrome c3 family protein [Bacteroidota bacterium]
MKRLFLLILIPVFALLMPFKSAMAEDKKCMDCHSAIMAGKMSHKPVTEGCDACHTPNGQTHPQAEVKGFALAKAIPDLCYSCHKPWNTKANVHAVVSNGKCLICHSSHSSDNPKLLKETPVGKICMECHDDLGLDELTNKHKPVAEGNCKACHDPHQSDVKKLLKFEGQDLCYSCHTEKKAALADKSVHPPFRNKCVICHKPHGSNEAHMLGQKVTELCFGCHDELQADVDAAKFSHKAVKEGNSCITCHSPHSSPNDSLLKAASIGTICLNCHKLGLEDKKVIHGAVSQGKCNACHDPHKGDNKNLVKDLSPAPCLKCHETQNKQMAMAFTHPPFKNKCSICHLPHASDEPKLLKQKVGELCVGCHDDFEEPLQKSKVVHGPLKDAKACTNCHSPHASPTEKILLADQKSLCVNCHSKAIKVGNRTLANMKQLFQKNKYVHGAIEKNGCTGCHNPHYAENENLLVAKFGKDFYTQGVKDSFALCFTCHKSELLTEAATTTATSFRNGDKNLHFVHVNGAKGRNCNVCHDVHAANLKHLLNEKIPFGDWAMKMNYKDTLNGGSCGPGCHGVKTYQR